MNFITSFKKAFKMLTPLEMAANELADAQRTLLEAQSAVEYSQAMVTYDTQRIARLRAYIAKETTA